MICDFLPSPKQAGRPSSKYANRQYLLIKTFNNLHSLFQLLKENMETAELISVKKASPTEIKRNAEITSQIKKEIGKVFFGHEEVVDSLIRAILCDGHVLVEGIPGIAKTLVIKALAQASGCTSKRIQFTVDLLPTDITGLTTYDPQKGFEIVKGPIFANFIVADEINRSPPKCVLGDTPIITENGEVAYIRDIIKKYNGKKTLKQGNEQWTIPKKPLKLLAFDLSDYKIKPEEVKYLYKQKTKDPYYEVELKTGRKIKTSPIHPFFTLKDGKVINIQAKQLRKGDCVLIPRKIPVKCDNKLLYNDEFLNKSEEIVGEVERRKRLYMKIQQYKKLGHRKIKEKLKVSNKKDDNLIKTFMKTKPRYIGYSTKNIFFSEAKQFGQIHGIKKSEFITKEFAQFMAILISEGSVSGRNFYLTMKNEGIPKLFIKLIKNLFDLDVNLLYDKKRKQYRVAFSSISLIGMLKSLGYNPHLKAGKKSIPKFILTADNNIVKEFLRVYYDCDGGVSRDCVKITTKSEKIANSLAYLSLRLGFVAHINKELSKTKIGNYSYKRKFYNLRLYGGQLYDFSREIGFYSEENNQKLKNLLPYIKNPKKKKTDLIPDMHHFIREFRKSNHLTHKEFYSLTGMHAHNLENPKNALTHSRYRLGKITDSFSNANYNLDSLRKLIKGDFYCDFVKESKSIKPNKEYWLYDFSMKERHSFVAGFGGIISHNTQSALIEAMQEKQVTIGKTTFPLPLPFFVMANQNPLETEGVYTLPEAQVDRFIFKVVFSYPKEEDEMRVMEENVTFKKFEDFEIKPIVSPKKIIEMQKLTHRVYLDEKIKKYILGIVKKTRDKDFRYGEYIELGGSPRASIALFIASKAEALLRGRNYVVPKDIERIIRDVLRHRIILTYRAQAEGIDSEKIIKEIMSIVKVS